MKKLVAIGLGIMMIGMFSLSAGAGSTDNLYINLTNGAEANIAVTNSTGGNSWNPEVGINEAIDTDNTSFNLENTGLVTVNVDISAEVNGTDWSINTSAVSPMPDHNILTLGYNLSYVGTNEWTYVNNTPASFKTSFSHDADQDFGLYLAMPTSTDTADPQSITMTFTATAN